MRAARFVAGAIGVFIAAGAGSGALAQAPASHRIHERGANQAVYLIKGLAGFQTGVVDLGERLRKRGIVPRIDNHLNSDDVADEIAGRYRKGLRAPVILVGYSLGADAAASIARRLNQHRVPVALLVTFAPVRDAPVTPNVARAINYYQSNSLWNGRLVPVAGFRGSLRNMRLDDQPDINHLSIISADRLQAQTISYISALVHARRPAQTGSGTSSATVASPSAAN